MNTPSKPIRQMPKGGRKGGAVFPRINLADAVGYAKKLVSKTHVAPQALDVIHSGVVGAKSGTGNVRVSALKQFNLLKGDNKVLFSADDLAKRINGSPEEELVALYRQAALKPTVFKKLFDTYHGDSVSKAKLRQRALDLKVHPDEASTCIELYVQTMEVAKLVKCEGDQVTHLSQTELRECASEPKKEDQPAEEAVADSLSTEFPGEGADDVELPVDVAPTQPEGKQSDITNVDTRDTQKSPKAVFNVNVSLDSSLDIEKLEKQLQLLKRFGAI